MTMVFVRTTDLHVLVVEGQSEVAEAHFCQCGWLVFAPGALSLHLPTDLAISALCSHEIHNTRTDIVTGAETIQNP
jgi:hypothetical protein